MPNARNKAAAKIIERAWRNAKAADPSLTQGEFAQRTLPGRVNKRGFVEPLDQRTAARELSKIIRGESNKAVEYLEAARANNGVNIEIKDRKGRIVGYANVLLPAGASTFDVYALRDTPEARRLVKQIARRARRDSPPHDTEDEDIGSPAGNPYISSIRPLRNRPLKPFIGTMSAPAHGLTEESPNVIRTRARAAAAFRRATEANAMPSWIERMIG